MHLYKLDDFLLYELLQSRDLLENLRSIAPFYPQIYSLLKLFLVLMSSCLSGTSVHRFTQISQQVLLTQIRIHLHLRRSSIQWVARRLFFCPRITQITRINTLSRYLDFSG